MSVLLSCKDIGHTFMDEPLFEGIDLHIDDDERVGILGDNGSGKSTLLKIMAGLLTPDSGERVARKGLRLGFVPQEPEFIPELTVEEDLFEYARVYSRMSDIGGGRDSHHLTAENAAAVGKVMSLLGFDNRSAKTGTLSGGWKKRLAIGRALLIEPDLLLLDEPTNHLDLEGIGVLERLLLESSFASVAVTHDRAFLERIATRVVEVNRRYSGGLISITGAYSNFLEKRGQVLESLRKEEASLAGKVRREIEWLKQGPKARTTKARGRLDEAERLIEQLADMRRRRAGGESKIDFFSTGRKSKRLLVAQGVSKTLGGKRLFSDVDLILKPKLRLGLVGDNGTGKTTLLRLLAKEIEPDAGEIKWAENLKVVYFEQARDSLDPEQPLRYALSESGDRVIYRGESIHVVTWARRFLFDARALDLPVGRLSGGEQAKLLIARLMLKPADILLLDEPTNDLDISTLEVLEESLLSFPGAIVMVTHDRYMIDRVCDLVLGLDGDGDGTIYGDYAQWQREMRVARRAAGKGAGSTVAGKKRKRVKKPLTYAEEMEYATMEGRILEAEEKLAELQKALDDPEIASNAEELKRRYEAVQEAEAVVEALYRRWSDLEQKLAEGSKGSAVGQLEKKQG